MCPTARRSTSAALHAYSASGTLLGRIEEDLQAFLVAAPHQTSGRTAPEALSGIARVGESCEFPRLRWAVIAAFHTGPAEMEKTADSMESAPPLRGHLSVTVRETLDAPETSLLNCEVPAPGTGHDMVTANHRCETESSSFSSLGCGTS